MKKQLKSGYTTGSCAAAGAKAAAWLLFEKKYHHQGLRLSQIRITLPDGSQSGELEIAGYSLEKDGAVCGVIKDAGDDPDITHGMIIYAKVSLIPEKTIIIDGGEGVGRVTKKGLDQPVGMAAINSVPRKMITQAVTEVMADYGYNGGLSVVISIPGGEEKAKHTLNPVLGIVGGLSVLGTTGIVEPMSEKALIDTIAVEIRMRMAEEEKVLLMTPGNYGMDYLGATLGIAPEKAVTISNYVGESLDLALEVGAGKLLLVGHIGKLIKIAAGIMNTHSRFADGRMEILTAHAAMAGADTKLLQALMDCVTTDAGLELLSQAGLLQPVMDSIMKKIEYHLTRRTQGKIDIGVIMFSKEWGLLAKSKEADALLAELTWPRQ